MNEVYTDQDSNEISSNSPNFRTDLAKKLEELVPEAIADGKVDVVKLKELLAEDAGEPNERFGLFWPGKKQALRAAQDPTTATLKPAKDESKDWDTTNNIFIEGDNLEVLKVLQKQYHNSIKMIYIDPPYNTGKDFVYPDNFKEGLQNYLEFSQQVDEGNKKISTNTETAGRYHSNWLNMMYPRLKLARNLLTDDGVIFISISDAELDNLRKMCSEIFGESNFLANVVWANREGGGSSDSSTFKSKHEYMLVYARNVNNVRIKGELSKQDSSYSHADEYESTRGRYKLIKLNSFSIQYSESMDYGIDNEDGTTTYPSENGRRAIWRWSKKKYEWGLKNDFIVKRKNSDGSWTIYTKQYFKVDNNNQLIERSLPPNTLIDRYSSTGATKRLAELFDQTKFFDYPKPVDYIAHVAKWVLWNDDIILDFFAGSATTAHAVMQLNAEDGGNRKHIMVQLPEPTDEKSEAFKAGYKKISDIARERINRAGEKIKADFADKLAERETPLDVGYRTYKLADTNFTKWQSAPTGDLTELQARLDLMRESSNDNASEEDLLVEVLLKMGLPLTTRTKTVDVDGLHVHQVVTEGNSSEGQPVLYLNEHVKPTLEQLRVIITDLTPSKFVILDDAFQGDNQLKTNLVQTCKSYDVELWTV